VVTLPIVAANTGADKILPNLIASLVLGDYVIHGHRGTRLPAVLATVPVAFDDVLA
jgi:hypothetical protein